MEIFIFWHFGLKLPISAHFPGHISTKTPKGPSLRGNMSFEPQSVKIDPAVPPGRRIEKKVRTVKKVVIFCLFGKKPPLHQLKPKFAWWVISPM